jgi:hypothetical protein
MNRNMTLCQDSDAGHAAVRLKMMKMDVQQGSTGCIDGAAQSRFDVIYIVKPRRIVEIHDEMHPGAASAILHDEMVIRLLRDGNR